TLTRIMYLLAMKRSLAIMLLVSLLLTGCSNDYPLKAIFRDGELYFAGAENDWFFGDTGFCPNVVSVRAQSGQPVWQIETDDFIHPCELFPLRFGSQP